VTPLHENVRTIILAVIACSLVLISFDLSAIIHHLRRQ
jgi:hypothetical protein